MNRWLEHSIEYANQRSYLDDLFRVYPTIPDGIREIKKDVWKNIEVSFDKQNNVELIKSLLKLDLFPIKDSYIAYFRRDAAAIERNPQTINRIAGRVYEMGLDNIFDKCTEPKETNRQIGPMFKNWTKTGVLGIQPISLDQFESTTDNAILDASDAEMMSYAARELGYTHNKGLDFVGRFNGKYVIGETKFLTDFGGHQNAQFNDAISTIESDTRAIKIAILDGVLFIHGRNKMYRSITEQYKDYNIMSTLVLRDFLYQI